MLSEDESEDLTNQLVIGLNVDTYLELGFANKERDGGE